MFQVTINGKIENYEAGTPYLTIAKKHQAEYPQDIILVFVNGKLTELYKSLKKDCELKFVTTADAPGGGYRAHREGICGFLGGKGPFC